MKTSSNCINHKDSIVMCNGCIWCCHEPLEKVFHWHCVLNYYFDNENAIMWSWIFMMSRVPALWAFLFQACNTLLRCIPLFGQCIGNWQLCICKNIFLSGLPAWSKNIPTVYNFKHLTVLENVGTEILHCKWGRLVIPWRWCYMTHIYIEILFYIDINDAHLLLLNPAPRPSATHQDHQQT